MIACDVEACLYFVDDAFIVQWSNVYLKDDQEGE